MVTDARFDVNMLTGGHVGWVPENRRVGEVREGHLKIFEIISTQSGVLGMKIVLKSYP